MTKIMMVAAEASSVLYAQRILEELQRQKIRVDAFGVGSKEMEALGFRRLGKSEEMAVVGIAEVIAHYKDLKAVFDHLVEEAKTQKPSVAILMDYPDFNLKLAGELKKIGIPVVYYISPQIWAWRQKRIFKIKKVCDQVLLLFPFEEKFYQKHEVPHQFVGHPLLDEMDPKLFDSDYRKTRRNQCGIQDHEIVLGLMPGSRKLELSQHMPVQLATARILMKKYPQLKLVFLVAPNFDKEKLQDYLEDFRLPYMIVKDEPFRMIHLTDLILVASGTATLQVGLMHKPMVIMYKLKWLTGIIAKIFVRGTKFFGLANLILDDEVVPERWQGGANPQELARLLARYIDEPQYKQEVVQKLSQIQSHLGQKGVTKRVVESLKPYLTPQLDKAP